MRCDGELCGDSLDAADDTAKGMRETAKSEGWKKRKGKDLCPKCLDYSPEERIKKHKEYFKKLTGEDSTLEF